MNFADFASRLLSHFEITNLTPNVASDLYSDLGLDSLQAFELLIVLEEWAEVLIPPEKIPPLMTLGDAYNYFLDLRESPGTWSVIVGQD